jgi:hypothetical protein
MEGPAIPATLTFNTSGLLEAIRKLYPDEFESIMGCVIMAVQLGAMNAAHTSDAKRTMEQLAAYPKFDTTNMVEFSKFHRHVTGLTPTSTRNMITYNLISTIKLQLERLAPGSSESVVSKFVTTTLTPESAKTCQEVVWLAYIRAGCPAVRDSPPPPPPLIPIPQTASGQSPARSPLAHRPPPASRPLKHKSDEPAEGLARHVPTEPATPLVFRAPPPRPRVILVPQGSGTAGKPQGSSTAGTAAKSLPIYERPLKQ